MASITGTSLKLYAVDGRYFYAGILVHTGTIVLTAPILKRAEGHEFHNFRLYCRRRGWAIIDTEVHGDPE